MRVLVLGASGQIAQYANPMLVAAGHEVALSARSPEKIVPVDGAEVLAVDATDIAQLEEALSGVDVVYANLAGDVVAQAEAISKAMEHAGVRRIVFVSALGIYDEVPGAFGEWNNAAIGQILKDYRKAADILEAADLDSVILRPAWLTNTDEIDYETTERGEPFRGTEVSRKSVADLVTQLISRNEGWNADRNLGVNKPGTDGDKPAWF